MHLSNTHTDIGTHKHARVRVREHTLTDLDCIFGAFLFEVIELHDFSHDEAFLEVCVDLSRCLRGLGSFLWGNEGGRSVTYQRTQGHRLLLRHLRQPDFKPFPVTMMLLW